MSDEDKSRSRGFWPHHSEKGMSPEMKIMLQQIADEAAQKAVRQAFTSLGIDHGSPIQVQQDMAHLREMRQFFSDPEVQADFAHIRELRTTMNSVKKKSMLTLITIFITGFVALFILGIKSWILEIITKLQG